MKFVNDGKTRVEVRHPGDNNILSSGDVGYIDGYANELAVFVREKDGVIVHITTWRLKAISAHK